MTPSLLLTVLVGPRQSGKTTSASSLLDEIPVGRKFCINLDSSFERDRIKENEDYLQEQLEETLGCSMDTMTERFYLFVDEA
ncbi:MAG: AAA family ATPase [Thermodesulfobacteriota bacterium]|nr:AAA family ATPase [Thermodesulfobacteriota bacterium]